MCYINWLWQKMYPVTLWLGPSCSDTHKKMIMLELCKELLTTYLCNSMV